MGEQEGKKGGPVPPGAREIGLATCPECRETTLTQRPNGPQINFECTNRKCDYKYTLGEKSKGKGKHECFVATAAFGNTDDPVVAQLRRFRDRRLLKSAAGRWVARAYYRLGPWLATPLQRWPQLRPPVQFVLRKLARYLNS